MIGLLQKFSDDRSDNEILQNRGLGRFPASRHIIRTGTMFLREVRDGIWFRLEPTMEVAVWYTVPITYRPIPSHETV